MLKKHSFTLIVFLLTAFFVSACGYRGALYLPDEENSNQQVPAQESSSSEVQ